MSGRTQHFLAWWQLLRAGNAFTAASNVTAGFLVVRGEWQPVGSLVALLASSILLYESGMVLNDVFDAEIDATERPERPIPSGKIKKRNAMVVGFLLLACGVSCGLLASLLTGSMAPLIVAFSLSLTILAYDVTLKSTPLGPMAMGCCRCFNVLLGASVGVEYWWISGVCWVAAGVGFYTVGLTVLARNESQTEPLAKKSNGFSLWWMGIGLGMIIGMDLGWTSEISEEAWWFIWVVLVLVVGYLLEVGAYMEPEVVRCRVKRLILFFIVIDAFVAAAAAGWISGLAVLALLIPTIVASKWAAMT